MGYYSTVVIAVKAEGVASFESVFNSGDWDSDWFTTIDHTDRAWLEPGDKAYIIENVKWYKRFPEVQAIRDWMDDNDDDCDIYKFLRRGEHVDDLEERGEAFEELYFCRTFAGIQT